MWNGLGQTKCPPVRGLLHREDSIPYLAAGDCGWTAPTTARRARECSEMREGDRCVSQSHSRCVQVGGEAPCGRLTPAHPFYRPSPRGEQQVRAPAQSPSSVIPTPTNPESSSERLLQLVSLGDAF